MLGLGATNLKGGAAGIYSPIYSMDFGDDTENDLAYWLMPHANIDLNPWHEGTWSIHMWIKPTDEGTISPIYTHADTSTDGLQIYLGTDEKLNVKVNNVTKTASSACTAGAWNHIFIMKDPVGNDLKAWLNGSSVISDLSFTEDSDVITGYRYLGYNANFSVNARNYSGKIFDWAIWRSDKSSDIAAIYNGGKAQDMRAFSPEIWYSFGNSPYDTSSAVFNIINPAGNKAKVQSQTSGVTASLAEDTPTIG